MPNHLHDETAGEMDGYLPLNRLVFISIKACRFLHDYHHVLFHTDTMHM